MDLQELIQANFVETNRRLDNVEDLLEICLQMVKELNERYAKVEHDTSKVEYPE